MLKYEKPKKYQPNPMKKDKKPKKCYYTKKKPEKRQK